MVQRGSQFYGTFDFTAEPFRWGNTYRRPAVPASEYVVYEVPLRTFTASPTSGLADRRRGTFLGFRDKVTRPTPPASPIVACAAAASAFLPLPPMRERSDAPGAWPTKAPSGEVLGPSGRCRVQLKGGPAPGADPAPGGAGCDRRGDPAGAGV